VKKLKTKGNEIKFEEKFTKMGKNILKEENLTGIHPKELKNYLDKSMEDI